MSDKISFLPLSDKIKIPDPLLLLKNSNINNSDKTVYLFHLIAYKNNLYLTDGIKSYFKLRQENKINKIPSIIINKEFSNQSAFFRFYLQQRIQQNSFRKINIIDNLAYHIIEKKYDFNIFKRSITDDKIICLLQKLSEEQLLYLHEKIDSVKQLKNLKDLPVLYIKLFLNNIKVFNLTQSEIVNMFFLLERAYFANKNKLSTVLKINYKNVESLKNKLFELTYPHFSKKRSQYLKLTESIKSSIINIKDDYLLEEGKINLFLNLKNESDIDKAITELQKKKKLLLKIFKL